MSCHSRYYTRDCFTSYPEAACVSDHSRACERIPPKPPSFRNSPPPSRRRKNPTPSCCRSCGGMRGWPLPRPTHAPATTLKTNGNSAPIKPVSFPSSKRVKESPQTKNPSCRHSVAACVSDHSRGQYMLPQRPPVQPQKNPPPIVIPESPPQGGLAFPPEFRGNSFTPSPAASLGNFVV